MASARYEPRLQAAHPLVLGARSSFMGEMEVHGALARAAKAGLYVPNNRKPTRAALQEFLVHGVRYAFAAEQLRMSRGIPTAFSAPVLSSSVVAPEVALVWPDAHGDVRGEGIEPLYRSVPRAARTDERLYRLLALVDALRIGGARERRVAAELLQRELRG